MVAYVKYSSQSDQEKKTRAEWMKEHSTVITFRILDSTDQDLIEFLGSVDNKAGTIKTALREYIQNHSK